MRLLISFLHAVRNSLSPGRFQRHQYLGGLSIVLLLTACSQAGRPPETSLVRRTETVSLPTSAPTTAPSPVNTRVLPQEIYTAAPTEPITPTITPLPGEVRGLIVRVIDGDTVEVVMENDPPGRVYTVKYIGIETPPNTPDNPWGVVAYETNREMTNLEVVRLVRDQTDYDDEGQLLRYVYVGDELMSIVLAETGLARSNAVEPNTQFQEEIEKAETGARNSGLGLWGQPPTPTSGPRQPTATGTAATSEATATVSATEEPGTGEPPTEESSPADSETTTLTPEGSPEAEGTPPTSDQ